MTGDYIEVTINKPLYEYEGAYFVNIRDKFIREARKKDKLLKINVPAGTAYYTWQEWMKGAKKSEQVFKFKDRPMKFVGNYVDINHGQPTMDNYLSNMQRLSRIFKTRYAK